MNKLSLCKIIFSLLVYASVNWVKTESDKGSYRWLQLDKYQHIEAKMKHFTDDIFKCIFVNEN